jgi:hypothetical protein
VNLFLSRRDERISGLSAVDPHGKENLHMNGNLGKAGLVIALGLMASAPNSANAHFASACWNFVQSNCLNADHSFNYCKKQSDTVCNNHAHDDEEPTIGSYSQPSNPKPVRRFFLQRMQ